MKIFFEKHVASWLDRFDIFDEYGKKIYHVIGKADNRKLKIYDAYAHNKYVASLRECGAPQREREESPTVVEIKHGKRFVSTLKRAMKRVRSFFDLNFLNWHAEGDFGEGNYRILDANDRVIASVGDGQDEGDEEMRCIDALPEFVLHAVTFTLAIDEIASEEPGSETQE